MIWKAKPESDASDCFPYGQGLRVAPPSGWVGGKRPMVQKERAGGGLSNSIGSTRK